jgi:hypothetical protein
MESVRDVSIQCDSLCLVVTWSAEYVRGCNQKFPDWIDNEMNNNNKNKHSLRSNTKGYGSKTH